MMCLSTHPTPSFLSGYKAGDKPSWKLEGFKEPGRKNQHRNNIPKLVRDGN